MVEAKRQSRLIGYWRSLDDPDWPDPGTFVDREWDSAEREMVAEYLETAPSTGPISAGRSFCRFGCGWLEGTSERTDGHYIWTESLPHYLTEHTVRLPAEFIDHVKARKIPMEVIHPESTVGDGSWWRGQQGSALDQTYWTPQKRGFIWYTGFHGPSAAKATSFLRSWPTLKDLPLGDILKLLKNPQMMGVHPAMNPMPANREDWEGVASRAHWLGVEVSYEDEDVCSSPALRACRAFGLPDRIAPKGAENACRVMILPSFEPEAILDFRRFGDKAVIISNTFTKPVLEQQIRYHLWPPPWDLQKNEYHVPASVIEPFLQLKKPTDPGDKVIVLDGNRFHWSAPDCSRPPSWWEAFIGVNPVIDKAVEILMKFLPEWYKEIIRE